MNRILKEDSSIAIENAKKIVSIRDKVNGYDKIDDAIIWGIVSNHLPKLKIEVDKLLNK